MRKNKSLVVDLTGQRFDKRVVLSLNSVNEFSRSKWNVRCDCGREFICLSQDLRRGGACKGCRVDLKADRLYRRKRPYEWRYNAALNRARHPMLLTYDDFFEFTKITECHYCGAHIEWGEPFGKNRPSGLNLDRKDSEGSYTKANVVVACRRCNYGKNNFFTYEEWKELGEVIRGWRERDEQTNGQSQK